MYAQRLAEHGYITVTADAAYQGASGGVPRNVDKPANRIEDIHGMADFISQYPGVDSTRIGLLGICGGGGYSLAYLLRYIQRKYPTHGLWCAITEQRLNFSTETGGKSEITTY